MLAILQFTISKLSWKHVIFVHPFRENRCFHQRFDNEHPSTLELFIHHDARSIITICVSQQANIKVLVWIGKRYMDAIERCWKSQGDKAILPITIPLHFWDWWIRLTASVGCSVAGCKKHWPNQFCRLRQDMSFNKSHVTSSGTRIKMVTDQVSTKSWKHAT